MYDNDAISVQIIKTLENSEFPIHIHDDLIESIPDGVITIYIAEKMVMNVVDVDKLKMKPIFQLIIQMKLRCDSWKMRMYSKPHLLQTKITAKCS